MLPVLFERAAVRARELQAALPGWPCALGCDACCRRLARVPQLTRAEWAWLEAALAALPAQEREDCLTRARALAEHVARHGDRGPLVCPLLDEGQGACRVYAARPLACRTYGFYAGHHHDAWCERVAAHVAGRRERLVLGNLDAIERELDRSDDACAERRDLLAWLFDARHA